MWKKQNLKYSDYNHVKINAESAKKCIHSLSKENTVLKL